MTSGKFLARCGFLIIAWLVLVATFNVFVDPYGLWGSPRIDGFNAMKAAAGTKVRMTKKAAISRAAPRTVVVGNSRPEAGLNPESGCWPDLSRPVFNFGIPGMGLRGQLDNALLAMERTDVQNIILALDFFDFISAAKSPVTTRSDAADDNAFAENIAEPRRSYRDLFAPFEDHFVSTFSLDAFSDSVWTILSQFTASPDDISDLGFYNGGQFMNAILHEGQAVLFRQKNDELAQRIPPGKWIFSPENSATAADLTSLRAFLAEAMNEGIDLVMLVNPYHADLLDLIVSNGYADDFGAWKETLTTIAIELNVAFWDFSGYHPYAMPRSAGVTTDELSSWFWEPSHYRKELGDLMLARLYGSCGDLEISATFGERRNAPR